MLEWLKNLGGNRKPWQNKAGLEEMSVAFLAEDFKQLESLDPDLPVAVVQYVLDGEGESVLNRLAGTPGAREALGLVWGYTDRQNYHQSPRARLFASLGCEDAPFFVRLGKVYEAVSRAQPAKPGIQFAHLGIMGPRSSFGDPGLKWLEFLLIVATRLSLNTWPQSCHTCPALNAGMVEKILQAEGHNPSLLVRTAFQQEAQRYGTPTLETVFKKMPGLGESAVRHKSTMLEILAHPDFKIRIYALGMMKDCNVPLQPFVEKLVELSLDSSKQVREMTRILLVELRDTAKPMLEEKIRTGENEERLHAVELLWHWEGEKARAFLEARLPEEKNKKVQQAIQERIAAPTPKPEENAADDIFSLPPLPPIPQRVELGPETEKAWTECFIQVNNAIRHIMASKAGQYYTKNLRLLQPDEIEGGFRSLAQGLPQPIMDVVSYAGAHKEAADCIKKFLQRPEIQPVHLVRFLVLTGALKPEPEQNQRLYFAGYWLDNLVLAYRRTHPEMGLRELAAALTAFGLDASLMAGSLLNRYYGRAMPFGLAKAQVWPFWMEHLDQLEQAFAPASGDFMQRYDQTGARENAFEILACFPKPPPRLAPLLWKAALGPKSERPQAQRCLEGAMDKLERLIPALAAGSAEARFAAAEWLARLGDKSATDALLAALKKEKNEITKSAMMQALEQLGAPVDQFLDRDALLKEAQKGIAKEVAEDLKWFPFDQLPAVHWQDTEQPVAPEIVRWWVIQGFKLKNAEPGALLRRYCASIKRSEREVLGQFVLEAWLAEDTAPIPRDEAEKRAQTHAQQMVHYAQYLYQNAQKNPQSGVPATPPPSVEQLYAQALPEMLKQPKGSAIASKGVLSVAGACAGASAAPVVNRYLKEWYGQRAAQCKALLQMLAWVEHRTAIQLMLAVGTRFRTKSIQEEANKLTQALAERKGWTVAELADRTIPSAGLDETGVLTIDYGPRQFTAKLNEELEFVLTDAEGKVLKSLPDPRKDDDEAKATEAKKMFSAAKKELKSVLTMQRERFYEAMCTQRTWSFEDWNLYLNQHPIARHLCQGLVWAVIRDEKAAQLFRPLPDGSLTDAADNPVELANEAQIRVAHECQVTPEESKLWRDHLKDYEVETLFEQFGRTGFALSEERKTDTDLSDFQGHLLEAFKLRGRASKLGYTRGQAQDGGWFFEYHKRFPTLGIEAVLEFTGNGLPEENRTVALTTLHFDRVRQGDTSGDSLKMLLSEVPSVLLSECWNDVRSIAAEGPGFDPDWEKKSTL